MEEFESFINSKEGLKNKNSQDFRL